MKTSSEDERLRRTYSSSSRRLEDVFIKTNVCWVWTETHEQALNNLKQSLSGESCVSYFDNHIETFIYTEASPRGISAILLQKSRNQANCKIVAYSSRALTSEEKIIHNLNADV